MFENLKLNNLKKKSAEEIKILAKLKADCDALKPASFALQPACEQAAMQRQAWALSHGPGSPRDRFNELDAECKRLEAQRDNPTIAANKLIGKQENLVRATIHPFQSDFGLWGRQAMQCSPYEDAFVGYIQKAIAEIDGMSLQPLEEVLEAIKRHCHKIETWTFEEKPKNPMPMFRPQDVMANA